MNTDNDNNSIAADYAEAWKTLNDSQDELARPVLSAASVINDLAIRLAMLANTLNENSQMLIRGRAALSPQAQMVFDKASWDAAKLNTTVLREFESEAGFAAGIAKEQIQAIMQSKGLDADNVQDVIKFLDATTKSLASDEAAASN